MSVKAVLYGAGGGGRRLLDSISEQYEVVGFIDSDERKWGKDIKGIQICSPNDFLSEKSKYDVVIITTAPGMVSAKEKCIRLGVDETRIITTYVEAPLESRRIFLKSLSELLNKADADGSCAEAGVFEGDFAKYINMYFPDRTLHLFDTFEGFDERDINIEKSSELSNAEQGDYSKTSVGMVLGKMPYPDKCIIHKGFFPETAKGIDEKFCFVNLDMDLYQPTLEGLRFFQDKMVSGGIILIHDYFAENFKGPRKAVDEFVVERPGTRIVPIGDGISIMVVL